MKKVINIETNSVTFSFGSEAHDDVTVSPTSFPAAIQAMFPLHGIAAKVGDAAAIAKSADNGFIVTEAMRHEAVVAMVDQLNGGDWAAAKAKSHATAQSLKVAEETIRELTAQVAALKAAA